MREPTPIRPGGRTPWPAPLLRTVIGDVLRRTRREQGRTLVDVAGAAAVSMQYLSEVERGRKEASSEVLAALCDALGTELADVLDAAGERLVDDQARRAQVIRLEAIRARTAPAPASLPVRNTSSGDTMCLAA